MYLSSPLTTRLVQVIAETNQGYIHSGVPLRCVLHCALLSEVSLHTPR